MDREHQSRLQAILNNAVDAIITIDEAGTIESANASTERVFGYSEAELLGQSIKMLMPSPYREEHNQYLSNYQSTGVPKVIGIGREVIGQRKDGSTFPMHLAVSQCVDGDKRLFTGIVRDISDLKEAQQELTQLNEQLEERVRERTRELREAQAELVTKERLAMLGQVSGGIAHEIRNPLNAAKASAYFLLHAKNPSTEKQAEHLQRIDRQVTLIDNVVTALSDVARMPEPNLRPVALDILLHEIIKNSSIPDEITVEFSLPSDLAAALADEHQIPIVFRNLVRNARDAMVDGGKLTIGGESDQQSVRVFVADTGPGIPAEELGRIMEPLYSTKARGMGLGLAITQTILDKNGGELQVESKVGEGSRFTVVLQSAGAQE